ncbi:putative Myb/SANT-like domain-containing protein [Lupinus albus]|uniref:Putative Myb/SANT-like domain-containing protein n=1 Tax=Lupinus albus TaxID=3870 RepID=A0A6A4P092_LUPAL|nr:putative Myb/SANT-like domain-containing protein [Lupinus albus]
MKNVEEKNKSPMDHPSNDGERKSTKWEDSTIELLIDCAIEQANLGEQTGSGLTSTGWRKAKAKFKIVNEMSLDDVQIKNKWENIKKWQTWYKTFGKKAGLGWNPEKNNFEASAEWWERKMLVRAT